MRTLLVSLSLLALTGCAVSDEDWARGMRAIPQYETPQRTQIVCSPIGRGSYVCN